MSPNDSEKKPPQTSGLKRLNKPGTQPKPTTQNLVEQVPPWLKRLLTKYGEREGPLVGLGEGAPEVESLVTRKLEPKEGLTALLNQMAEEGVSTPSPDRSSTSVEWGRYDEPTPPPIDDFLANLGSGQADNQDLSPGYPAESEAPDWINDILPTAPAGETGYNPYATGAEPPFAEEAPAWLTEMIPPDAAASPPPPAAGRVEEAPDWLAEALEIPTTPAPTPPPREPRRSALPGTGELEVPDWLTEALEPPTAPASPGVPPVSLPPAETGGPDWLVDTTAKPTPVQPQPSPPPLPDEAPYEMAVPDWLEGLVATPDSVRVEPAEPTDG
ncbi:MAG: hypothetical protein HC875_38510 [Anaerolineales bacterium]|nr:hypothetical protein [Anaerolineales bacterium]